MPRQKIFPGMMVIGGYEETTGGHNGVIKRRPIDLSLVICVDEQGRRFAVLEKGRLFTIRDCPSLEVVVP